MPRRRSHSAGSHVSEELSSGAGQSSSSSARKRGGGGGQCKKRSKHHSKPSGNNTGYSAQTRTWMTTAAVGVAGLVAAKTLLGMFNGSAPTNSSGDKGAGGHHQQQPQQQQQPQACPRPPVAAVHHPRARTRSRSCSRSRRHPHPDPRRCDPCEPRRCDPDENRRQRHPRTDVRTFESATTINAPSIITGEDVRNGILLVDTTGVPCVSPVVGPACPGNPVTGSLITPSGNIIGQFAPAAEIIDALRACNGDVFKMLVVVVGNILPAGGTTAALPTGSFTITTSSGSGVILHSGNTTITSEMSERLVYVRITNTAPGMEHVDVYF